MLMYWLMANSTPAAHPSTNSTSRMIIGGLRSVDCQNSPKNGQFGGRKSLCVRKTPNCGESRADANAPAFRAD
jgi:hypothetical protein